MNKTLMVTVAMAGLFAGAAETVRLDSLPLAEMTAGWGGPRAGRSVDGKPLSLRGRRYERGVGTHALSSFKVHADGKALAFDAVVGVDDDVGEAKGSVVFFVKADGATVAKSPKLTSASEPYAMHADLKGAKVVELFVCDARDGDNYDHADWCDAYFTVEDGSKVVPLGAMAEQLGVLTPKAGDEPRINGPSVYGVRPSHPVIYRLPVSGARPMKFAAESLPQGLRFDAEKGVVTGAVAERGDYAVRFTATNAKGTATRTVVFKVGDKIALTPPMGWNSWNCFAGRVTDKDIRAAADAFEKSGLVDHGWSYVNIDDFWQNAVGKTDDETLKGPQRNADGTINPNVRFPDMKGLADYVHAKGLRIGLYSSPGPWTCGGCEGSWGHEWQDAKSYADWGYDYLKYDLCGYRSIEGINPDADDLAWNSLPYRLMGEALEAQGRDIVYSLCQYGWGHVSSWGANVGGNSWRTTGDITDTWQSMSSILDAQAELWPYAGPGAWNDPDMLVIGPLGWGNIHPTRLTPNEQYTHMSFWCILCSPLLIGCDLTQIDDFSMSLLTNDEVLETNQDPLGAAAARIYSSSAGHEIWAKPMSDGSLVFALYNKGFENATIDVDFAAYGLEGEWRVRDLWRQADVGLCKGRVSAKVLPHATTLYRLFPTEGARLAGGVRDIRDQATYRYFEKFRPVGKPGLASGWRKPCADCPR